MRAQIRTCMLVATLLGIATPRVAWATLGVGVTSRSITINESLRPGESCEIPQIGVANTGDESAQYEVSFVTAPEKGRMDAEPSWFSISPRVVGPEPGRVHYVKASLELPRTVKPGDYTAFLVASPLTTVDQNGTPVRLAAGTMVRFTVAGEVAPEGGSGARGNRDGLFASHSWRWSLLALAAILCLALAGFIARNVRVSVQWGRRRDREE